jgi:3D (Asp-Asp-Asp) domain-containing protein
MLSSEASESIQPRSRTKEYRALKQSTRGYFWSICILFVISLILCANNFSIYRSYKETLQKLESAERKYQFIEADKQVSDADREILVSENNYLTERYEQISRENKEILKQIEEIHAQNKELVRKNKELTDDNVALQNSLKMAASAGIKPQNYTEFRGLSSRSSFDRGKYIGKFLGTAYTPSIEECGNNKGITNSGKPIIPGISIAIDNKFWPFGTVFYIKGLGYAVAMDTGNAIKGKHRFDFAVFDRKFAKQLGSREWDVYLVRLGNGKVEDIDL